MLIKNITQAAITIQLDGNDIIVGAGGTLSLTEEQASSILNNYTDSFVALTNFAPQGTPVLLGKKEDFNMNATDVLVYDNVSGGPFTVGETITASGAINYSSETAPFDVLGETIVSVGVITYSAVAGGPFTVGETITGGTSAATAVVISDDGVDTLRVRSTSGTSFTDTETITGGTSAATATVDSSVNPLFSATLLAGGDITGALQFSSPTNTVALADRVVGVTSGSECVVASYVGAGETAVVVADDAVDTLNLTSTNAFTANQRVTGGTSAAFATVVSYAIEDQLITLSGGTQFVISDILITNASISLTTAAALELHSAINQGGVKYAEIDSMALAKLTSSSKFILATQESSVTLENNVVNSASVYAVLGTPQGVAATADLYIFGYVLA